MGDQPIREKDPVVEAYKKDLDRSLFRVNLLLTVEERFLKAMELGRFAEEPARAGKEARLKNKCDDMK